MDGLMDKKNDTPRTLFVVNFDWRDLFRTGREEFVEKLTRDQLRPDSNRFFFFSWGTTHYTALEGAWQTVHTRTFGLHKLRPVLNLWALFLIPFTAWRYHLRPDAWVVYDFGMAPACWIARKLFGGRLVLVLNNQPVLCSRTRRFGWLKGWYSYVAERIGVGCVEHFFTLNGTMRQYLRTLGVPDERISYYVVNTIERDLPLIRAAVPGTVRERFHLGQHTKLLLTVARFEAEKNYPLLLDLFATLPTEYVLFCLGEGSLRGKIEAHARRLKIEDRLYLPGNILRNDIWNYYKSVDAFILLSKAEALGIVFWEAMYVGVPVLGSAVPGIMESLGADGERGRVWREADGPVGFTERVRFCTTPSHERDALVGRAKTWVDHQLKNRAALNEYLATKELS